MTVKDGVNKVLGNGLKPGGWNRVKVFVDTGLIDLQELVGFGDTTEDDGFRKPDESAQWSNVMIDSGHSR